MDKNSNAYTFIFAVIMVTVIAGLLAFTATSLKPLQEKNVKAEKMQNILGTIGVTEVSRDDAEVEFNKYIKQQLALKADGTVDTEADAFTLSLKKEVKKSDTDQRFPLYIAEKDGKTFYVVPLYGAGLWDAIWGYVALDGDKNTIIGANFGHKGETPGLGAEITTDWFQAQFAGKTLLKDANAGFTADNFVSVKAVKGGAKTGDAHGVDAISGGTITSDGVSNMVQERLARYLPYFKNN
ncbi:NADH:ubiquinone reductase (Na(+)-transporting) subunit C [Flavicella sp.]|uniref:NADH:ubiquinone reductase (Na(+)-transporting) subunit C n=1 Tax=Flavicella sp. TaxID=2957742 RepID=UPI00262BEE93|nr:NADH:ubiquinone reductase (Na(+)-transporting) subunit C [Flavicella sp.]MDG1803432.1 NADH:ubiquinone reductase (Na(+)-transporting) subunit C [Flavicella sp.]MDG2279948.1 NADH:ubiquinone reductase (Na(+)-transporting) subunit C [Flavicella sp.]